jgi:hypothetical protein
MKATYIWQMINQVPWDLLFFYGVFVRFSTRGVQKHHKKLFGKVHVKNFWPKKLRGKKNPFIFSHGVFVRFSTRGVQKHYKKLFGESPCQKLLAEKVEKKIFFLSSFPIDFFYRVFGRFSA